MRSWQACPVHGFVGAVVYLHVQFHHLLENHFTPSYVSFLKEVPCLGPFIVMNHQNNLV